MIAMPLAEATEVRRCLVTKVIRVAAARLTVATVAGFVVDGFVRAVGIARMMSFLIRLVQRAMVVGVSFGAFDVLERKYSAWNAQKIE